MNFNRLLTYAFLVLLFASDIGTAQNETSKWYFGNQAGLDFTTSPPGILTNGAMSTPEGCVSVADAAGNLLFYSNGVTVWTQAHVPMGNGTGLFGHTSTIQSSLIIKRPGSINQYYLFTNGANGIYYSVIDMSLAAGQGSVVSKNLPVYVGACIESLAGVKHCNQTDYWIVTRDWPGNNTASFLTFLVSSAGVNTVAVVSASASVGNDAGYRVGSIRFSPNGKKLATANNIPANTFLSAYSLYDFDNSNGVVSNQLDLMPINPTSNNLSYSCEFSPDGTKLYGSRGFYSPPIVRSALFQWNLCAGSNSLIVASLTTIFTATNSLAFGTLQQAMNGKIYLATSGGAGAIGVINNPNLLGGLCGFVHLGQSIAPNTSFLGLPNFVADAFYQKPLITPFTYSFNPQQNCNAVNFSAPNFFNIYGCPGTGFMLTGLQWDFGDPGSGSANTSTLANPSHVFSAPGTYTTHLIIYTNLCGLPDTATQIININGPTLTINTSSITCASLGSATINAIGGIGPLSYTWMPGMQTGTVAGGLIPGNYTITMYDAGMNCQMNYTTNFAPLIPLSGSLANTTSVSCHAALNGTASVINLSGGSPNQNYIWTNGINTLTTQSVSTLGAGTWSLVVTDALTACQINSVFTISQPPALTLNISSSSATACVGTVIDYTAFCSGGVPGYTYSWTLGSATSQHSVTASAGNYVYSVAAQDALSCEINQTVSASFIAPPSLTVGSVSICPSESASLNATGAANYVWNGVSFGNSFTTSPIANSVYTVVGSAFGCSAVATASVFIKSIPVPTVNNNSPICVGQTLSLSSFGGISYYWSGPLNYNSGQQNPQITPSSVIQSGNYSVVVTSANSCTAEANTTVIIYASPNLSATAGTICANDTLELNVNTLSGLNFLWNGPNSYTSNLQNPTLTSAIISMSGNYTVLVTSVEGCTNSAVVSALVNQVPVLSVSNVSICPLEFGVLNVSGATTYTWSNNSNGNTFLDNPMVSTQYSVIGSALGCTSIATASIILKPLPNVLISSNSPRCENTNAQLFSSGGVLYNWSGPLGYTSSIQNPTLNAIALNQAGVYNLTITAVNSCTASASTTVVVNPIPAVSATGATVCTSQTLNLSSSSVPGAGFLWSGPIGFTSAQQNPSIANPNLNRIGLYFVRATSAQGCTNIATATVSIIPPPSLSVALSSNSLCFQAFNGSPNTITLTSNGANSYTLFTPDLTGNGNPAGPSTTVSTMPPFSSTLVLGTATIVGSNGVCTNSVTRNYSVIPNPTVVITPTPVICAGENYTYTSFGASSYVWTSSTPNFTTYNNGGVAVAHPSINSVFSVFGTSLGCNSASQTSTVNIIPLPIINLTPQEPIICLHEKTSLTANGTGTSFEWFPAEGLNNTGGMSVIASPLQTKNYTVVASANNCTNAANITVRVLALPQPTIINAKEKLCVDETIILKGEGGVSFDWFGPQNLFYSGQEIYFKAASSQFSGDYTLTVTDKNGCKGNTVTPIVIQALPQGHLRGFKENVCAPYCGDFSFSGVLLDSELTGTWQISNQIISNNRFSHCFSEAGSYTIVGRIFDAKTTCSNTVSYQMKVNSKPQADFYFSPQKPVEGIDEVIFTNASIGEEQNKWNWFINDEYKTKFQSENISYKFDNSGLYSVAMVVTNKWNCADTAVRTIQVETDFGMYIPNAFTPNNDGLNDEFKPVVRSASEYNLKIFDRWGHLIFESHEIENGWDGTNRGGVNSKGGVYAWRIEVRTLQGESKAISGHVTLVR